MTVEMGGGYTPEEAKASFNEGVAKLIKADPHTYVLTSNDDFPWEPFKTGRCHHIPKYGIEPRPTPEGYEWRAAGTTAHLCPCTPEDEQFYVSQVCSVRYIRLLPVKFGVARTVPCKKCIAWAKTRIEQQTPAS